MVVGADQDLDARPMGADGPDEAAQEAMDLDIVGMLGRVQHRSDETALTIEHDDQLESIFVVIAVEQLELLAAVHSGERLLDVEHEPLRTGRLDQRGVVALRGLKA